MSLTDAVRATGSPERPRTRGDVRFRALGSEAMLYDPAADRVVRLNATAARIWRLLDGQRDRPAIAHDLALHFEVGRGADLHADVRAAIDALAAAGVLA